MAQEKSFENRVKAFLKSEGCYFVKQFGNAFTKKGVPDLLVCCNGKFLGLEIKAENGKPSELQKYNIQAIEEAGGIGMIVYPKDFELLKTIVKNFKNVNKI